MKIFLTGGSGMVGRNILDHPKAKHHEIIYPSSSELNLLDREHVKTYLLALKPDLVIHAAGRVGGIQANIAHPVDFLTENIEMGLNVIAIAAKLGIQNLINLASSCMYPKDAVSPLTENLILAGTLEPTNEGYALAKSVSTRLCEYISKEDPAKLYKTVIPCNLFGRYDKFDPRHSHLIPAVIRKIHEVKAVGGKTVDIWGDGTARREFMCAADLADFIWFATDRMYQIPQNLNVGLGYDYSIREYYAATAAVIGFEGSFKYDLSKPVGMRQKLVDVTQLESLGWRYKTGLIEGIRAAYNFYLQKVNHEL
jgi:GDP-L-fucose synthase